MELLNINTARATWLEWLKETYHFDKAPSSITYLDATTNALSCERGQIQIKEEIFVDINLKIFNDGIVAETQSSTHDSDSFLEDVLKLSAKDFSLTNRPTMIRNKVYFSELNVECPKNLNGMNPKLAEFAAKITRLVPSKIENRFDFAAIGFWPTIAVPHIVLGPFRFERKLHTYPSENKYYSTAPFHTDDHLKMLDEFETIFMS
jgi:hypothetical protein